MEENGISFEIQAKIDEALKRIEQLAQKIDKVGEEADEAGKDTQKAMRDAATSMQSAGKEANGLSSTFQKVGTIASGIFSAQQLAQYVKQIINVRANIEALQVSFRTLLGDEQQAADLFGQIKDYAVSTPMQMGDLAEGAKTMLGFGIESEKVMTYLKQLGDISMGDSEKFKSLTLAFSQATSTGKLMGQDLLQLINAGFNPLNEISKQTGKSIGDLKEEMSKGGISAEMLAGALQSATSEGGMFFNALQDQSQTINGAISNLQGAFDDMLNDIGEKSQDTMVNIVTGLTDALKNYEKFITILEAVIAAYGTYKGVLLATIAVEKAMAAGRAIEYFTILASRIGIATAAQRAFNIACLKNPYVLLAAAIIGVTTYIVAQINATNDNRTALEKYNAVVEQTAANESKKNAAAEKDIKIATDAKKATSERVAALKRLQTEYPKIFDQYNTETILLANILDLTNKVNEANANGARNKLKGTRNRTRREEQEAYDEYNDAINEAAKDRKNRGVTTNSKFYQNKIDTAARKLEEARAARREAEKTLNEYNKGEQASKTVTTNPTQNKKYWEDKRDKAQAFLDALPNTGRTSEQEKEWQKLTAQINEANKALEAYSVKSNTKKSEKDAKQNAKEAAKYEDEVIKQKQEAEKRRVELENETAQLEIDALRVGAGKRIAQIISDYEKEKEAIAKAESDLREEKYQNAKKLWETNNKTPFTKKIEDKEFDLTTNERKNIDVRIQVNEAKYNNDLNAELDTISNTRQSEHEKRLAQIDLDYKKEKDAIVQAEKDLREAKYQEAKKLWETKNDTPFEGKRSDMAYNLTSEERTNLYVRSMANDKKHEEAIKKENEAERQIQLDYLEQYGSYEKKKLAITQKYDKLIEEETNEFQKKIYQKQKEGALADIEATQLNKQLNWSGVFGDLASKTKTELAQLKADVQEAIDSGNYDKDIESLKTLYNRIAAIDEELIGKNGAFGGLGIALDELKKSQQALEDAEKRLKKARITGDDATIKAAEDELTLAKARNEAAKESINIAKKKSAEFVGYMNELVNSIGSAITGGSWGGIVSNFAKITPTIDSTFGTNLSGVFDGLGEEMTQQIDNIVSNIGTIVDQLKKTGLTEQEKSNVYLNSIINSLDNIIDEIGNNTNTIAESIEKYNDAKNIAEEADKSAMQSLYDAWTNYKTGHNSYNYKVNDNNSLPWDKVTLYINNTLKKKGTYGSISDLAANLNTTDLKKVLDSFPQLSAAIDTYSAHLEKAKWHSDNAKELASEAEQALENALKLSGKLESAEIELNLAVTGVTFDNIEQEFKNTLNDMKSDSKDFSDNLENDLKTAVVNGISKEYSKDLKKWYEELANMMEGGLTPDEASYLRASYTNITDKALADRNAALQVLGLDTSSSVTASQKSVASMSEDTASELNGRFTALQIAGNNIDTNVSKLLQVTSSIDAQLGERDMTEDSTQASSTESYVSETKYIQEGEEAEPKENNIENNVRQLLQLSTSMGEKLDTINMSILACNSTLTAINNTNIAGFRSVVEALGNVQSAINNKL